MKKSKTIDETKLGINPFLSSLTIPVNIVKGKAYKLSDDVLVKENIELEATPFTKVYISSERRKIINNLSSSAQRLLLWIMFELDEGRDWLYLNKSRYLKEQDLTYNTYTKARDELIRYCIIYPTVVRDVFWINPDFFFQGNRIKKFKSHVNI